MVDRIVLSGIRVQGRHGVSDEERSLPQDFELDLTCSTDARAAARDDAIGATIDYVRLRDVAIAVATGSSYRLIETLAERIASAILEQLGPQWVRVRVTKLRPEGVGVPASVEIERGVAASTSDGFRSAPIELHVADFAPAKRFYGALGFVTLREEIAGQEGYLVMGHAADLLRFWPGTPAVERHSHFGRSPATTAPGHRVELVLTFDALDAAFEAVRSIGTVVEPIRRRHWGLRDFRVLDPYGFYVRCTEPHDPASAPAVKVLP